MEKYFKKIIYTHDEIVEKCKELAKWVDNTYKNSKDLLLVGLLKGSVPFLAELIKHINIPNSIDFMTVSSYEGGIKSNGNLKIVMDLKNSIHGKDVLIVEDIVDSGLTLNTITEIFKTKNPESLRVLTLLDKPSGRKVDFKPDKFGFRVPNVFLAGFGLDVKERLRGVPFIGEVDLNKINEI